MLISRCLRLRIYLCCNGSGDEDGGPPPALRYLPSSPWISPALEAVHTGTFVMSPVSAACQVVNAQVGED